MTRPPGETGRFARIGSGHKRRVSTAASILVLAVSVAGVPSKVVEIVDVRDVGEPDTPSYADARLHLRDLLGVRHDGEEDADGDGH